MTFRPVQPFIVGAPRSGTTLLRFMLCAGNEIAIPPETGFLAPLTDPASPPPATARRFVEAVAAFPTWSDFGLSPEALRRDVEALGDYSPAGGVRAFYRAYARRHGCPRYGDKTPTYLAIMPRIAALLPEAAFVHIIRDGRDAALSLRHTWFAPSQDFGRLVDAWAGQVGQARADGATLARYHEVRFEDLVRDPRTELAAICEVLGLEFRPAMLDHAGTARRLLAEHGDRHGPAGALVVSREQRLRHSLRTAGPVDPARAQAWRDGADSAALEAALTPRSRAFLAALGY